MRDALSLMQQKPLGESRTLGTTMLPPRALGVLLLTLSLLACGCWIWHGFSLSKQLLASARLSRCNQQDKNLLLKLTKACSEAQEESRSAERAFAHLSLLSGQGISAHFSDEAEDIARSLKHAAHGPVFEWIDAEALLAEAGGVLRKSRAISSRLSDSLAYFFDASRLLSATPSIRPAPVAWLSSSYGVRRHPIFGTLLMHKGLDLAGFIGLIIIAPADGTVVFTGVRGGYGRVVVLDHGYGLQTHFAHLSKSLVHMGNTVRRGDPIAEMGTSGNSTGPHLHYEVRRHGQPQDPRRFILD